MDTRRSRRIGMYGGRLPGPLLIVTGAMHGNEPAGIQALERVFNLLDQEERLRPGFVFRGCLAGLAGNLGALQEGRRFMARDMNRMWDPEEVARIRRLPTTALQDEEAEMRALLRETDELMAMYPESPVVVMDLHTTTAGGGIFCIATEDPDSMALAAQLHAPVILGLLAGIRGTTMHYFRTEVLGREALSFAFEAGQHTDPLSVDRAIAAVIACMRALGMVAPEDVENRHDAILEAYSRDLPRVCRVIGVHPIRHQDAFVLAPGFINFQPVHRGQWLGKDGDEDLVSPVDALILMPRYQRQGDDGYFLLEVLDPPGSDQSR